MMAELAAKPVRVFVVWEPVLFTDWSSPSTATLGRISDGRVSQFWDKERVVSHSMGERDRGSIVWDYVAIYAPGAVWEDRPPKALYAGGPVVRVIDEARTALDQALKGPALGSEDVFQRKLQRAISALTCNQTKRSTRRVRSCSAPVRMIQNVEHLEPELKKLPLDRRKVLPNR